MWRAATGSQWCHGWNTGVHLPASLGQDVRVGFTRPPAGSRGHWVLVGADLRRSAARVFQGSRELPVLNGGMSAGQRGLPPGSPSAGILAFDGLWLKSSKYRPGVAAILALKKKEISFS